MVSAAVVVGKNVKVPFSSIQSWRWTFWVNAILVGLVFIWAYYVSISFPCFPLCNLERLRERACKRSDGTVR